MSPLRYLIVGGGMTGHAAAAAIRERDALGAIMMLAAEQERPYARPPLSKGLWLGKPEESIWLPDVDRLVLLAGRRAVAIDRASGTVLDDAGARHGTPR
jgi:3-phenylpropionate/trans-cinnamate dioxygenase ferredoxin reductase subunit